MRALSLLITQARRGTENTDFTNEAGIKDEEFIQYANDAQDRIFSLIQELRPALYLREKELDVVSGQANYSIPADCFMGTRVDKVEYSPTGLERDYYLIKQGTVRERFNGNAGSPFFYFRRGSEVIVNPRPQEAGKLRLTYQRTIPYLGVLQATVSAVSTSGTSITSLTLDPTSLTSDIVTAIQDSRYISIVDIDGNVKMRSIPVTAVTLSSGAVTIDTFAFESGETIAVGNKVVLGKFASHVSQLPDTCERYLLTYMGWKINKRDSSSDSIESNQELQAMEQDIVQAFAEPDSDVDMVPILDTQYLDQEGYN